MEYSLHTFWTHLEEKRKQMESDFEIMLLPKDPNDGKD